MLLPLKTPAETISHLNSSLQGGHAPRQLCDLRDGDKGLEVARQLLHRLDQVRRLAVFVALHRPLQLVCVYERRLS